ncbi:MAG: CCA tRNA nucleotidyltransferase, partial [Candidatus Diapherotrites archaeon]|nr:CCA tRNA nucleotidyltransferase [Candidatus Diapherotrites archaeon]
MPFNYKKILGKITPSAEELKAEHAKSEELINKIKGIEGKHVGVILAGSISRNTHLRGDNDLDIFVLFDKELSRKEFEEEGLRIAKQVFKGHEWELAYSEHPYIRGVIDGFEVEIIPSYKIHSTVELRSAVDRTPFHTKYLQENLTEFHKPQVRLLKQFLKGIKSYGSDLKTSSFSGYITELLVLKYGSFVIVLKCASDWEKGQVIDLENHLTKEDAKKEFNNFHFIIVDPTDRTRNVSAAVSFNQYCRFISAARAFLKKPSEKFFFQQKQKYWKLSQLKKFLQNEEIIAVQMNYDKKIVSDVFWGLLKRFS